MGTSPILWHVMKYYALFGHGEFVPCLGYKADKIKDFTLSNGGRTLKLCNAPREVWRNDRREGVAGAG